MRSRHDDDDGTVRDGESVVCPFHLMDSVQRRAVAAHLTDAQVRLHQPGHRDRDACLKAYRDAAGLPQPDPDAATQKSPYENYKASLGNAWKGQTCTPYAAASGDLELAQRLAPLLGLSPPLRASSAPLDPRFTPSNKPMRGSDGANARREYVKRLGDAWRTPVDAVTIEGGGDLVRAIEQAIESATDPDAAVEHEKELERWQGRPIAELTAAVETRRKAIHVDYAARLSNAWRSA